MNTPWGTSQSIHQIADGIESVSTAGHGGIHLSRLRIKELKAKFPEFVTFVGNMAWYEEDCDSCVVVLAFPERFNPSLVKRAFNFIKGMDGRYISLRSSEYWKELETNYASFVETPNLDVA